jgi:hemoglobin-like flavoprotein
MTSPSAETFLASLKRCLAAPGFLDAFYDRFMGSSDEIRQKFRHTDMKRQSQVLADTLYVVANAVQGEENSIARGSLPALAARHSRKDLDIRPELYDLWIECLVQTVRAQDLQSDAGVERAWREALAFGADYMRQRY